MKKVVAAHQPEFLPYIGFFHRLLLADLFIIADSVQYEKQNFQNRNRIKTKQGEKWITASLAKHSVGTPMQEIMLSQSSSWKDKHLCSIKENYKKAPFFTEIYPFIEQLYSCEHERLRDFNMQAIVMLCELFDIKIDMIYSSTIDAKGTKNEYIVDMLKKVQATAYLSGDGAKKYYDSKPFETAGIEVIWQNFKHPVYKQINGDFIPYMSSIDLLLNCGIEASRQIIRE